MRTQNCAMPYLKKARRQLLAGALTFGLVLSGLGATAALAEVCRYSDGRRTLGPCMQLENGGNANHFDLFCQQGPTSTSHRIHMNRGDSFTCRVERNRIGQIAAKINYNGNWTDWTFACSANQKNKVRLTSAGSGGYAGTWSSECVDLAPSLRW